MENPEIGSSASGMENPDIVSGDSDTDESTDEITLSDYKPDADVDYMDMHLILKLRREDRKYRGDFFRSEYTFGRSLEQKTCIWSGRTCSWPDKSSGIMWVGVHGMDSICVVTRTGDLDVTRAHSGLIYDTIESALHDFRVAVISEIEDLEDPSSKLRGRVGQSIEKPFGVVSGIPCIDDIGHEALSDEVEGNNENSFFPKPPWGDEETTINFLQEKKKRDALFTSSETIQESSVEYDDTKAIQFLKEKMESKAAFTVKETIQTTICAFQHLFQKKFKASEIEVSVVDPDYWVLLEEADYKDLTVKELEMKEIEEHLAVINEPSSA